MRIVHVADSFAPDVGGIERQVEALARCQQEQGHDVTVITAVNADADLGLHVVRALPGRWLTVAFPWRNHRLVAQVLDGPPIDVVHAHFTVISPIAVYAARAASRRGIPVAITVHSLWWKVAFATRLSTLPFGWGRTTAVWSAVSNVAAGHVRRTLRHVTDMTVVPNLVDVRWWRPAQPPPETDNDDVRLILVGRLKRRKHIRGFLDVLAEVHRRIPAGAAVRVDIVGAGPRRADLQRQIDSLGLADRVTLLGHREPTEIRTLLHHSHLFIASSHHESFGIAALEARAAGLPVIGYRGNGLADFITDDLDGALAHDEEEMASILTTLITQPEELRRLRKTSTALPPTVGPEDAMVAIQHLYSRALAMPPVSREPQVPTRRRNTSILPRFWRQTATRGGRGSGRWPRT